jgi:hypothetical protein
MAECDASAFGIMGRSAGIAVAIVRHFRTRDRHKTTQEFLSVAPMNGRPER